MPWSLVKPQGYTVARYFAWSSLPGCQESRRRFTFWNCGFVNVNHSYVDCDVFVTVAKYKDHPTTGVSTVMKNLFGLTPLTVYGNGVARASGNADDN
jgi:hypothetical protein